MGVARKGTKDSKILCWCEENNFILVTNNRRSMPTHLAEHITQGGHIPGIITVRFKVNMGRVIENLI